MDFGCDPRPKFRRVDILTHHYSRTRYWKQGFPYSPCMNLIIHSRLVLGVSGATFLCPSTPIASTTELSFASIPPFQYPVKEQVPPFVLNVIRKAFPDNPQRNYVCLSALPSITLRTSLHDLPSLSEGARPKPVPQLLIEDERKYCSKYTVRLK